MTQGQTNSARNGTLGERLLPPKMFVLLLAIVSSIGLFAALPIASSRIYSTKAALETNSLTTFIAQITISNWSAPTIHSQWYVDRLTNAGMRAKEQQNRDFGLLLARKLDNVAGMVASNHTYQVYEINALTLMRVGKWIGSASGYGNLMLGHRCYNIAYICLTRMMLDLSCPVKDIESALNAYDLSWYSSRVVTEVLNDEVGVKIFGLSYRYQLMMSPVENVARVWEYGSIVACRTEPASSAAADDDMAVSSQERRLVLSNIAFFKEPLDEQPEPLVDMWNSKRHYELIQRIPREGEKGPMEKESLQCVLRYRRTVGFFPTNQVPKVATRDLGIALRKAFEAAWVAHYTNATRNMSIEQMNANLDTHNAAASFYEQYLCGQLIDEDTRIRRESGAE